MTTIVSAPNAAINGTSDADWISSGGDGASISALGGNDYVASRGNGGFIYGGNDNDTLVFLPSSGGATTKGGGGGKGAAGNGEATIRGNAGNDDITIIHDSAVVYGDVGDDYMTVKLYNNSSDAVFSINNVTLTGGDGRDTFYFNTALTSELDELSTVTGYRIEALITDFSSTAHLCFNEETGYFIYSILTDSQGNYTDIVLTGDSEKLRVTLQGVTNIDDIVYATAVRFVEDSLQTSYLGEVIANYTDDMSAIPAGISYDNYTVYVYDQYTRNVWLMGTDEINKTTTYRNISAKTLDARNSTRKRTLVGNWRDNVIYAGSGGDSLWGGSSNNDTMYGGNGRDMFWYGMGDGTDFIRNFSFGSADNSDVLNFYNGGVEHAYRDNNTLHMKMTTGEELLIPTEYSVDTEIQYSTDATNVSRAKIGDFFNSNTLTYDPAVNLFMGGAPDNTLKVDDSRKNLIWLDGSYGQSYYEITNIDASESTGDNQLAGANNRNINIVGGAGNSSLWGGNGQSSNDTLTGGTGAETFYFGKYEGNDLIIGASDNDTINLFDISLDDVTVAESIKGGGIKMEFEQGAYSLTLENVSGTPTFALAQGGNWVYEKKAWVQK